jgi:hypothetical protein
MPVPNDTYGRTPAHAERWHLAAFVLYGSGAGCGGLWSYSEPAEVGGAVMPDDARTQALAQRISELAQADLLEKVRSLEADREVILARLKAVERATPLERPKSKGPLPRLRSRDLPPVVPPSFERFEGDHRRFD